MVKLIEVFPAHYKFGVHLAVFEDQSKLRCLKFKLIDDSIIIPLRTVNECTDTLINELRSHINIRNVSIY